MEQVQPDKKGMGGIRVGTTLTDMKVRIAEHLISQAKRHGPDEVFNIISETKVGARRRAELINNVRLVFSIS